MYSFIEYICYDLKDIDVSNFFDCDGNCDQHNVYIPMKKDQKAHG